MSEHDHLLDLFNSLWSETPIFTTKPSPFWNPTATHDAMLEEFPEKSNLSGFPTTLPVRSMSEADVTTDSPISFVSVLSSTTPKLETVVSGREAGEYSCFTGIKQGNVGSPRKKRGTGRTTRRETTKKKGQGIVRTSSRSLSELEFEELKGFMDLGFVFSERDRDSALISIIPGLQRLGGIEGKGGGSDVSRPYLSEAWGVSEEQRKAKQAMEWRVPAVGYNETEMKDHLKFWAHAVASTVR